MPWVIKVSGLGFWGGNKNSLHWTFRDPKH